jgi:hypothetical protein
VLVNDNPQSWPGVDTSRPSPARMYDYYLGGTANLRLTGGLCSASSG